MLFICYPKCSTCKKARKLLDDNGISYEVRDIKENRPTAEDLSVWIEKSGLPLRRFFNTSGVLYRSMGLSENLAAMSESEQLDLLASDGMLVRRPLLIGDDFVLVGFRQAEWEKALRL